MLSRYTYDVKDITITLDKEYNIEKRWVNSLVAINDYEKRRAPIIEISLALDNELISKIFKYKDKILIKLEIIEIKNDGETVLSKELLIKSTFNAIPSDNENQYNLNNSSNKEGPQDSVTNPYRTITLYLIDLKDINYFDKEASMILNNAPLSDALAALFKIRDIPPKSVIATPPRAAYEPIIAITRGNLISNVNELNVLYGLYPSNVLIYKDWFYIYCLNKINPNIILNTVNDFVNVKFTLENEKTPNLLVTGSDNDNVTKTHIVNINTAPAVSDMSSHVSNIEFSTILGVNRNGDISKKTINPNVTKMKYVSIANDLTLDQNINEIIGPSKVASITIPDSSIRIYKPYKIYSFDLDSQYALRSLNNDKFRLVYFTAVFKKEGDLFTNVVDLILAKI